MTRIYPLDEKIVAVRNGCLARQADGDLSVVVETEWLALVLAELLAHRANARREEINLRRTIMPDIAQP